MLNLDKEFKEDLKALIIENNTYTYNIYNTMKINQLKEIIRPVIIEEVQKLLPKLLFEMLKPNNNLTKQLNIVENNNNRNIPPQQQNNNIVNRNLTNNNVTPQSNMSMLQALMGESITNTNVSQQKQPRPYKKYSNNPMVDEILNETMPGLPQTPYGYSHNPAVEVENGGFDKIGMMEENYNYAMPPQPQQVYSPPPTPTQQVSQMMQQDEIIDEIPSSPASDAMTNMFGGRLKAILDKSKKMSPKY